MTSLNNGVSACSRGASPGAVEERHITVENLFGGVIVALFCVLLVVAAVALWASSGSREEHPPEDEITRDGRESR